MSSEPLLARHSKAVDNADSSCCGNPGHPSTDTSDAAKMHRYDEGNGVIHVGYLNRHPWATLASLKHEHDDDSLVGGSPRHATHPHTYVYFN